jgi:protocatechuate 3,4-dioxygenase beta subunit
MFNRNHIPRFLYLALFAVASMLLAACGGPEIALTGTITDAYTNKPVPAATVKIGGSEATTDAAGKYQLAKWSIKNTLEINAGGYETASIPLADQPQLQQPTPPSVTLDATIRPNTLSGTITDDYSGQPVAGAAVKASDTISATTGADGRYTLAGVPESFTISVSAPDHDAGQAQAERTTSLDLALRPDVLAGTVKDAETGEPVAGATITAGDVSSTSGADGTYRLERVPAGATVHVSAPGYATLDQPVERTISWDAVLQSNVLTGLVTDAYTGKPIEGAEVKAGTASTTTGADGNYRLEGVSGNVEVELSAEGYSVVTQTIEKLAPLNVSLRPDVLQGTLVDASTGKPIKNATIIATVGITGTDVAFTRIDDSTDGSFTLEGIPEQGYVQVLAPGYNKAVVEIKTGEMTDPIKLEPFEVRALYITGAVASAGPDLINEYLDLIDTTELNTIVVDLKSDLRDDLGLVYYDSQAPLVKELKTSVDYIDMPGLLAEIKKRGIYAIARIQLFSHDNALADARPEWAIKDRETGKVYADYPGPGIRYAWLDPWNKNVWEYNVQLAVEAANLGFDEVNFDYIRYPDSGNLETYSQTYEFSQPTDPKNDPEAMYNNIVEFMKYAHRAVNGAGAFMSIDIFGRVMLGKSSPISQDIARMAPHTDYICPMPYPSLWWPTYLGFDNPTAHPYEVILGSLKSADPFFEGKRAVQRPWLQDHTDPWQGSRVVEYGPKEVRAQIDAVNEFGKASGWMLYDSANTYTEGALKPEP